MRQTNIYDFLEELAEQIQAQQSVVQDETPTRVDEPEFKQQPALIDTLITNRINKHITDGTFPTLEEVQSVYMLDQILRHYNA